MERTSLDEKTTTVSPDEAARRLGLQTGTLANMRHRGDGPPYIKVGNRIRYRLSDLAEWLEVRVRTSTSDAGPDA